MSQRNYSEEEVEDLTDRVFLLREQLSAGKIHFAEHLVDEFRKSFEAIRIGPTGLVDPTTVDGRIRSMTLALRAFKYRQELKDACSLSEIQEAYFRILDVQFGSFFQSMLKAGANPGQAGAAMARDEKFVRHALGGLPGLVAEVKAFWKEVAEIGELHLQDATQLKASFAGDIFPPYWENAVSLAGLYVDTIVLPCPIIRLATILEVHPTAETVGMFMKHVLTAMTYRPVATANVSPPIALVLPAEDEVNGGSREGLISRALPLSLRHAGYLFGRTFTEADELVDFCSGVSGSGSLLLRRQHSCRGIGSSRGARAKCAVRYLGQVHF